MSKISTYEVAPVPKLSDKLIGTSVGGEIEDITYNFTLLELLELFLPIIPANNLQGVLDYGNTATQDINLFGTITTTNLDVTDTANLFITYLNEETHLVGSLFDSADSVGTAGQVLTSTGDGVEWFTLPPIFTPNLEQVLTEGNTSSIDILLDANLEALDVSADTATVGVNLTLGGTITDNSSAVGSAGQVLSSTVTGVAWVSLPVYSATSPLLFNSATGVFSIQVANSTQGGYLTANDWVTFDGKQNAGAYITALTGEATATGPGSVPITLNNASVTAKVLTGLNVTGGSISASDSILTAFGKVQSQINGLMGGVQYQGVWNAATNTPTLTSSVGTQGHYYIVNVAGSTDLNGITDWKVGDWAIFSGGTWQKVDNTESVTSVNGQTGAVSLTTDNIPEGATNLYYLDSRARAALSFAAGSGAYNSLTGVITIPTNNNQILNGANYITLASLSATSPLLYNNLTGVFSIPQATALVDGYLSATDWSTFNGKQNYLGGTGLVKSTAGTITYITDNSGNWNTAYNRSIVSAAVTGTTTKTLTLNEQDGNTITASWTDLDTGLTSVGVSMPSAFSVANSPLTSNGTIAVTGAGTTLEYIDGTGALRTFPGLTGYVPYTGATQNVDLGEFGISAGYFQADLTPTGALQVGRMQWNSTDGTMDLRLMGNNVTLQIGQENVSRVVNKSGIDLLEANYQVVRVRKVAEGGAQGQRLAVVLAQGNNENNSTEVIGLVTETILVNQEGFVTAFGEVKNINTTGSLQGETWVDGDILYVSTSVAGQLTNVRPVAPNHAVTVGYVTYAHANNGKIYMAIDTGYELGELHNVYAPSPAANASIWWNISTLRYENNTIAGILGYTPANPALYVPYTGATSAVNLGSNAFTTLSSITGGGLKTTNGVQIKYGDVGFGSDPDYLTIESYKASTVTSLRLADGDTLKSAILIFNNSADYNYTFPNASGTLALTSDLTGGTVTSVAALTIGTSGTDLSSTVANPTTTPVITLNVPTASAANRGALSAADWSTFNTKVGAVTASSPLASSGGSTPNITIQQASGSQDGYLSSTDWTTFNNKQASGNYITSLTGEATGTGPGATAVTLNNASVTAKILTGINITGGTVQATDTMLTAFGKLQNQINGLIGSTIYQGTWNASTNTPALASGVGVRGYYYIVSVAGNTNLDGITDWFVGDWAIFDGTAWQQVDNTDAVVSVNGQTGAVSLTTDNIPEGATNQYFLNSRARAALSFTAGSGAYNSTTGVITIPTNTSQLTNGANYITLASLSGTAPIVYSNTTGAISITQAGTASNGYLSSTDWNTFNNKQATITLTTTGTSGAATLVGTTLNIPQYQSVITNPVTGTGTANEITYWTGTSTVGSLSTATYPSLTELSYVKGVTSSIQTQVNAKAPNNATFTDANLLDQGGFFTGYNPTNIPSGQTGGDWGVLNAPMWSNYYSGERYTFQFAANLDDNANIFVRKFRYFGSVLQSAWYTLLHSGNYSLYALPLTGGTLTGQLNITYANARFIIGDGTNVMSFGLWDTVNNRIEAGGRPLYIVSYGGTISIGRSGGDNLVVDTGSVTFGNVNFTSGGNVNAIGANISGVSSLAGVVKHYGYPYKVYQNLCAIENYYGAAGAIAITTNIPWDAGNMLTIKVKGYDYNSANVFELTFATYAGENNFFSPCYTSNSNVFANSYSWYKNSSNKVVLVLGSTAGNYPYQVYVSEFKQGYNSLTSSYADGWTIAPITSTTGLTNGTTILNKTYTGGIFNGESVTTSGNIYASGTIVSANQLYSYTNRGYNGYASLTSSSSGGMLPAFDGRTENSSIGMYFTLERASNIAALTGFTLSAWRFTTNFDLLSGDLVQFMNNYTSKFRVDYAGAGTFSSSVTASSIIKAGGTSSQFLMADGSVNTSVSPTGSYLPLTGGTLTGDLSIAYTTANLRLFLTNTTATTGRSWYFNSFSNGSLYIGNTTASDIFNFSSAGVATFSGALNGTSASFSSSFTVYGTLTLGQTGVTNGIINSNDGMYFNIDADASGSTPEFMFGKGRSGSGSGGTTLFTIANSGAATFISSVSGTSIRSSAVGTFGFNTANNGEFQIYATVLDGMIMAGRGSTHDMVITNKSGSDVLRIPTGTTNVQILGTLSASNFSGSSSGTNTGDQNLSGLAPNNASFGDANAPTTGGFFTGYNATNVPSGLSSLDMGLCNMPLWGGNNASERYTMQLFANLDTNSNFYIRKFKYFGAVNLSTWYILLHSGNFGSYAVPLSGGTMTGQLTLSYSGARVSITDGTNGMTIGLWDGANCRIETAGRPLYMVSYGGAITIGRSSGTNLVVDTSTVTYGSSSMSAAGVFTGTGLDISTNSLLNRVKYTQYGYRVYRNLARFDNYNNGTGAIAVYTNIPWDAANMLTIQLKGFRYGDRPFDITVACYAGEGNFYSPGYFSNSANAIFGTNGYTWYRDSNNKVVIVLGNTSGSYGVQIWAAEYKQGFGGQDPAYADGWSIAKITTTSGLSTGVTIPDKTYTGGTFNGETITTSSTIYSYGSITSTSDVYSFKNRTSNGFVSLTTGSSGGMLPQISAQTENGSIGMYFSLSRATSIDTITGFGITAWRMTTDFTLSSGNLLEVMNNYSPRFTLTYAGVATFASSVTATAFYESSDKRLKQLIKDDYKAIGIDKIKPKLYIKDGKEEVGYFAQDVKDVLSTAVSVNDAGFLSLSYTQVHTAKIAIIEDEVDVLKKEVAELKVKLQKYES